MKQRPRSLLAIDALSPTPVRLQAKSIRSGFPPSVPILALWSGLRLRVLTPEAPFRLQQQLASLVCQSVASAHSEPRLSRFCQDQAPSLDA